MDPRQRRAPDRDGVLMEMLASYRTLEEDVKNGTLSGVVVSKSIAVPVSSSAPVFTAPAAGKVVFVLTQFCRSNCPELSGSTLGRIGDNSTGCTTYFFDVAAPPGEVLTCTSSGCDSPVPCTITGVVTKK